jgi:hypothetical protein
VNHFYIYNNTSDDFERLISILTPYIEKGFVTLIKWNYPKWSKEWENSESGQTSQQNHTLYRFCDEWLIGLPDVDEYVFPMKIKSFYEYLKFISKIDKAFLGVISGISIRTIWFGCNFNTDYNPKDFLYKLTMRKSQPEPRKQREKCFVYPKKVKVFSIHRVLRGRIVFYVPYYILRFNHYYTLSKRACTHEIYDQVSDDSIRKIIE